MNCEINIATGIDNLLKYNNLDILRLLIKDSSVDIFTIAERAKIYFLKCDYITQFSLVNFFLVIDAIDIDLAQNILIKIFASRTIYDESFNLAPMDTIKKLISHGAVIPSDPIYLCKLKLEDFIRHVEINQCPINWKLEAECVKFRNIDAIMWIRKNTCEPQETIMDLIAECKFFFTNETINIYASEFIDDPVSIDNMIAILIGAGRTDLRINNRAHVCSEELSFFIVLYDVRCNFSLCDSMLFLLHPNIKKYIRFDINKYLTGHAYDLWRNMIFGDRDRCHDDILKNSRMLLDHIESLCVFDN